MFQIMHLFNNILFNVLICTDDQCRLDCKTWTVANGQCANGAIIDSGKITLYSDSNCSTIIPGSDNIPILFDAPCNVLLSNLYSRHIGSYIVSQSSPDDLIIASGVILLCFCMFYGWFCCCYKGAAVAAGAVGQCKNDRIAGPIAATAGPLTVPLLDPEDPE